MDLKAPQSIYEQKLWIEARLNALAFLEYAPNAVVLSSAGRYFYNLDLPEWRLVWVESRLIAETQQRMKWATFGHLSVAGFAMGEPLPEWLDVALVHAAQRRRARLMALKVKSIISL